MDYKGGGVKRYVGPPILSKIIVNAADTKVTLVIISYH